MLDITDKKAKEVELEKLNEKLKLLAVHLQQAREEEKKSVAYTIHEELGQQLAAIQLQTSQVRITEEAKILQQPFDNITRLLSKSISSVEKISNELYPSIIDDLGFTDAMKLESENFSQENGIKVHFQSEVEDLELPSESSLVLFRAYQGFLYTAHLYGAKEVRSTIKREEKRLSVIITINKELEHYKKKAC